MPHCLRNRSRTGQLQHRFTFLFHLFSAFLKEKSIIIWFSSYAWNHYTKDTKMQFTYNFKPVKYIILQKSRQTVSAKQNINFVFFQICFSSHKHFPTSFIISIDQNWENGYIHKLLCHLEISRPWNSKDYTTLCSNSLGSQLSETLTFEANIFHFLSKPLHYKLLYQFLHLTEKDFSKLIDNFNTKHN